MLLGHWRIADHGIDDIALELSQDEADAREDETIDTVGQVYSPATLYP